MLFHRRETFQIGVIFINDGQDLETPFKYSFTSPDFNEFVAGLGTMVDLSKHSGYCGELGHSGVAPYYSDYRKFYFVLHDLILVQ